ncbi:MAG TPA: hypothetical protein PLS45_09790, partial [Bacillota bacterium]|nr:hypothetical protein [Bacillota bacterium]
NFIPLSFICCIAYDNYIKNAVKYLSFLVVEINYIIIFIDSSLQWALGQLQLIYIFKRQQKKNQKLVLFSLQTKLKNRNSNV